MEEKSRLTEKVQGNFTQEQKAMIDVVAKKEFCSPAALVRKCTMEYCEKFLDKNTTGL